MESDFIVIQCLISCHLAVLYEIMSLTAILVPVSWERQPVQGQVYVLVCLSRERL